MSDDPSCRLQDLARLLAESMAAGSDGARAALAVEMEVYARCPAGMLNLYVLRGREPVLVSPEDYVAWRRTAGWPCRIAVTEVGVSLVWTEFLGADLDLEEPGDPVLFQTVVCSDDQDLDGLAWGARSYDEAEAMHARVVRALEGGPAAMAELLDEQPA